MCSFLSWLRPLASWASLPTSGARGSPTVGVQGPGIATDSAFQSLPCPHLGWGLVQRIVPGGILPGTLVRRAGRETSLCGAVGGHTHVTESGPCVSKNCTLGFPGGRSLRICLAMQEAPDRLLILEDPAGLKSNYAHAPIPRTHSANTEPSTLEPVLGNKKATLMKPKHCN